MDTFITVLTVQYPQQLWIIKGKLESEGIACFVKDELTVQAYNLYSNAVGGVKLQVQQHDVAKAVEILTELGYIRDEPIKPDLLTIIESKTNNLPFLKKVSVVNRIIILVLLVVFLITTIAYFIHKPSLTNLLTKNTWTVDKIYHKNKLVGPKTKEDVLWYEFAEFRDNNYLSMPGLQSRAVSGKWELSNGIITLNVDTLKDIYNGLYEIDITDTQLILKSPTTIIYAHIGF